MHDQRCATTRVELNDAENCEAASGGSIEREDYIPRAMRADPR